MSADLQAPAARDWSKSFWRGLACKCPACGEGPVFAGYLRVTPNCAACGEKLDDLRADDAPPYFTIFIVGHIIVPLILIVERAYMPPIWLHMAMWLPLTTLLSLAFLRPIKGAVVGVLWAQREKP